MNRVLAPAFYAQSDTKSPTLAGIISFAVNMVLAAALVTRFKGAGIAFALSFASAVNTAVLFYFLKRNPAVTLGRTLKNAFLYCCKLVLFSGLAVIPVLLLNPRLAVIFSGKGRFVSEGAPLFINALVFAAAGIFLLAVTRDKQFTGIVSIIKKTRRK
jgi:putative peptidoglycan lipid II flippase